MYYLEIKDPRKGLLITTESETVHKLCYSIYSAKSFKSRYLADKFKKANSLNFFRIIKIN
jgi:hypothetical protein